MTARLGPRFGLEAGLLIVVAVVLALLEISWPAIAAAMAIAWALVAAVELALARRPGTGRAEDFAVPSEPLHVPPVAAPPPPPPPDPEHDHERAPVPPASEPES